MSKLGIEFANTWIQENISPEADDPSEDVLEQTVQQLLDDAEAEGITRDEIEEDMDDDLPAFIANAFEQRASDEVDGLSFDED